MTSANDLLVVFRRQEIRPKHVYVSDSERLDRSSRFGIRHGSLQNRRARNDHSMFGFLRHQRDRFRSAFAEYDVRPTQFAALVVLLHENPLGQTTLGDALYMKRANVVKLLDELQGRGLIRRKQSKQDRRTSEIHLTAKGVRLTEELLDRHEKLEAELSQSLGQKELQQLVDLLRRFLQLDAEPELD